MMRSALFLLGALIGVCVSVGYAQKPDGVVIGTVRDAETGEALGRATVVAMGPDTTGTYADLQGRFRLRLRPGTYQVRISMVGYTVGEQRVELRGADTVRLAVRLYPTARQLAGVVVEARREWGSVESALSVRRQSASVMEVMAAEQMQRSGDADAGQALQRITGVTVREGKYVFIRGTNERYSALLLNGLPVAMTEPDRRAVALELFPSELLEHIAVAKSATAELPTAAGGVVEFQTMDIPEQPFFQVRIGSPYVAQLSFRRGAFQHYPGGSSDWLAWDTQWRRLPSNVPHSRQEMNQLLRRVWDLYDTSGARQQWVALGRSFNHDLWRRDTGTIMLLPNLALSTGWRFPLGDHSEIGLIGALTYDRSAATHAVLWRGLLADRSLLFEHAGSESLREVNWAMLLNAGYRLGEAHRLSLKNLFSRTFTDRFLFLEGADKGYQFLDLRHYVYHPTQYQLWSTQLSGEHAVDGYALQWALGLGEGRQQQPDLRRLRYQRQSYGDPNEPYIAEIPSTQQGDGTRAGHFFTDLLEKMQSVSVRGRLPFALGSLRIGASWEERRRSFWARSLTLIQARGGARDIDFTAPPEELLRAENFREDGLGISEDTKLSDSYRAREEVWATYAAVELPATVLSLPVRLAIGLRAELARQQLSSHLVNEQPVEENHQWLTWLPTLNAIVLMGERMQIRTAFFPAVTRPSFRELAPFAFFDVAEQALVQGNPTLEPAFSWNAEVRWEWYPTPAEYLGVGAFAKRIEKALEETIFPQQSELTRTFANAENPARLLGIELEVRKNLDFFGPWGRSLTVAGNYSWIYSRVGVRSGGLVVERQLWGQAPYSLNVTLSWLTPWKGELSLSWNRVGRRIVKVSQPEQYVFADPHIYELPQDMLDLIYRQPLPAGLSLGLKVRNLLGRPVQWEQGALEVHRQSRPRTVSLSLGYQVR